MNICVTLILILAKCTLIFAALTNHWVVPAVPEGRIVGGHEAAPHSHPYAVSLQLRFLWVRAHFCGGTLLNQNWVLTAGHCIKESFIIRWLPMDVVAGAHNVDKFGPAAQVLTVSQRIAHPLYDGGIGPNDIAMLKTSMPFQMTKEVQPVNLPVNFKVKPDNLALTGWGVLKTTFFFPSLPENLQEVNVTYIPYDECYQAVEKLREPYEKNPLNNKANICTGPLSGGIAGCNGDSGGPLIQFPVLLGVVSWGVSPCGQKGAPTVYTKVSNYLDFINQHINT
ncbi:trypsin-like [Pectinophora gossypiella]|uniref:trypsin-like n=1 Tax=Pectinophora gossypiella TaxID=13191 RepID=UPI00214E7326|nr:trypsin-like [Pectinophora gossypiella]